MTSDLMTQIVEGMADVITRKIGNDDWRHRISVADRDQLAAGIRDDLVKLGGTSISKHDVASGVCLALSCLAWIDPNGPTIPLNQAAGLVLLLDILREEK